MKARHQYLKLIGIEEAQTKLLALPSPLEPVEIPLSESLGRVLATPAIALVPSPAYHGAAMDGVALKASLTFGATPKRPKTFSLNSEVFWVNTGQPLPEGTDAVMPVERLVAAAANLEVSQLSPSPVKTVTIEEPISPWTHVRRVGEDLAPSETILPTGTLIGPFEIGALAAAGLLKPLVFRKPRIAFLPTGSEMIKPNDLTEADRQKGVKLPEFNSLVIKALAEQIGADLTVWDIIPDERDLLGSKLLEAAKDPSIDLIIVNAGSSAGDRDYLAGLVEELGEVWLHGLKVMPGKPALLGLIKDKPLIGLPGYPVSAVVAFEVLVGPLLRRWLGLAQRERPKASARLFEALYSRPGMEEWLRVKLGRVGQELVAVPLPRGAGVVTSLALADGIIKIPVNAEGLSKDGPVEVELLKPISVINGALLAIGSHDNALAILDNLLRLYNPNYSLSSAHVGSLGGLRALAKGLSHLAGSHLLGLDGVYNRAAILEHLKGQPVYLVRLAEREQGLITKPYNPLNIKSLADLTRPEVTFINRQRGSGTRVLLDWELAKLGLEPSQIQGYEEQEFTHLAVAVAVSSGRADVGLGVRAAAKALGLDFWPIGQEEYDLVIRAEFYNDPRIKALIEIIRGPKFKSAALALGGYGVDRSGEELGYFPG
ncbi:MAG: molybdopterin biosynthesis protein [Deltaproteobacteria bacterium]|jgi:putative molybdopterin biosynthesis protein|nr:molybdopterin biosynthesis protein [Deltaproteobacteria bacterium]